MESANIVIAGTGDPSEKIKSILTRSVSNVKVSVSDFKDADIVIENLDAEIDTRKNVIRLAEQGAKADAIIATTSPFGITKLAASLTKPERFIGLNFTFNPFQDRCLVQIVRGLVTSQEKIEICKKFLEGAGTTVICTEDAPGLVLDRVMALVINEAANMHSTGVASVEDIDKITRLCLNWPVGPFEFADIIGLDNILLTLATIFHRGEQRFAPCRLIEDMVTMGKLGKKSGQGFYNYS